MTQGVVTPEPDANAVMPLAAMNAAAGDAELLAASRSIAAAAIAALRAGNKILIAGNGGSAAEAQHFATELTGRYRLSRYAGQVLFIQMSALGVILALCIIIDNPFGGDTSLSPARLLAAISNKE